MKTSVTNTFKKSVKSIIRKSLNLKKKKQKNKMADEKPVSILKTGLNLFHRFFALCVRLLVATIYGKGEPMPPIKDLILLESATSLAYKIRHKKLKSVDIMNSFINRIKEVNPLLKCVVDERYVAALNEAAKVDEFIESGKYSIEELEQTKPFLGVPISTKDCIQVKGMMHTAGLYKRKNHRADQDAECIRLMRDAGAIPFALTNVSECCMWWESSNPVHGRTKNPYDSSRIVGGSSGGEGCLQAAAGSPFGIGSDIGGSIRMPSFFNGIFGHKTSRNIVSNKGQYPIPISEEVNSYLGIGPMCRFATDLKPMLKIMAGENGKMLNLDEPVDLHKIKYFYQKSDGGGFMITPIDSDIENGIEKVIKHLEMALKVKPTELKLEHLKQSTAIWFANMKEKNGHGFDSQLVNLEGRINPYVELVKWICNLSHHTFIGIMTALTEANGVQHGSPKHKYMVEKRNELRQQLQELLGDNGVFIYPAHPTVAPYHNEPLARAFNFSYTGIINVLGFPATSIPLGIGKTEGLPIGLQVVANFNQDRLCLAVACELERAFGGWVPPVVLA